jgi:hypothetical protein
MTPPRDYETIDVTEMIEDLYIQAQDINKKLDHIMYWCTGIIISLAICVFKMFYS